MTSIDLLKTITDTIVRKKAMHNLLIQHDKKVNFLAGVCIVNKFYVSIDTRSAICKFSWSNSKEGQKYWDNYYNKYYL
jgi:hypothetical protein